MGGIFKQMGRAGYSNRWGGRDIQTGGIVDGVSKHHMIRMSCLKGEYSPLLHMTMGAFVLSSKIFLY
jgi:hypothetical protein